MSKGKPTQLEKQEVYRLMMPHAIRLKVEIHGAVKNALEFARLVGIIESSSSLVARSKVSSATGLYQFIKGSIEPAVNRTKKYIGHKPWMDQVLKTLDCTWLSWIQQTLLFLGDILEKRGSDIWMTRVLHDGDREAMLQAYLRLHHTDPDEATYDRARRIFYGRPERKDA